MKKLMITAIALTLCICAGCGKSTTEQSNADTTTIQTNVKAPEVTDVSDTDKTVYFYRDDMKIYGKMYLPEGGGPFPVVIFSQGLSTSYSYSIDIMEKLTQNGIAGITCDYTGAVNNSPSDGVITDMSVLTQATDLSAVIDALSYLPEIDTENVFLWGHSLGGLVSSVEATQRPDDIKGIVVVEPSYQMHDQMREMFPEGTELPDVIYSPMYMGRIFVDDMLSFNIYDEMPKFKNNVLIIGGTKAPSIGAEAPEYLKKAIETFPSANLEFIEGADHGFMGAPREQMIEKTIDFVKDNIEK